MEAPAARVAHGYRAVLHPDDGAVLVVQPVLRLVGIHLRLRRGDRAQHALAVERVDDLLEEERVRLPLLERISEQVDDCGADVQRIRVRVDRRDVERERHVLDELPVAALEGIASQALARLLGDVRNEAEEARRRQGGEQMIGGEADRERHEDRGNMRGDEPSGAEQTEVHQLTIGIRGARHYPCGSGAGLRAVGRFAASSSFFRSAQGERRSGAWRYRQNASLQRGAPRS